MLWVAAGIAIVFVLILMIGSHRFRKEMSQTTPEYIIDLLDIHREDEKVALAVLKNGEEWLKINEKVPLPLASTVEIIIAIEFAQQAADQKINPQEKVSVKDIEIFDIPKTDGKAFEKWLMSINEEERVTEVTLEEIAYGMIYLSVNANTDYLIHVLGLEAINQVPEELGLAYHEPLFPLVSSLAIPSMLKEEKNINDQQLVFAMGDLESEKFLQMASEVHEKWLNQPPSRSEKRRISKGLTMPIQRAWAERLARSTAADYVQLMEMINSKEYFSSEVHHYLDPLLEKPMEKIDNQEVFKHFGQKDGMTTASITYVMYATDKNGERLSLALLTNDLNPMEHLRASRVLHRFVQRFLRNEEFRSQLKETLEADKETANIEQETVETEIESEETSTIEKDEQQ